VGILNKREKEIGIMALNEPKEPIKNNPFLDLTSSMSKMFSGMEQREKATNDKLDKLIKQMVLYYKLLENSYNKDKVSSKKGREESLNDDKGFLKLIDLMTKIDGNFKKTMDRYVSGQRLQLEEKKELAKFVQTMKDALSDSQEQIGVPIKDILTNFKKMVKDEKISNDFKLDLFSFLRDYSDEDLALSKELKGLLDSTLKTGKVNDEKIVNILMELDKNLEYYAENEKEFKTATFAPYKKLDTDLKEANVSLEEVVRLLTDNQRSNDKIEGYLEEQGETGGKGGKGKDEGGAVSHLARELKKTTADLADFAVVMTGKTAALGMAENPMLRGASPAVFSSAEMMGKGVGDMVKNFNPATDLPKLTAAAGALAPLLPYLAGGALVVGGGIALSNATNTAGKGIDAMAKRQGKTPAQVQSEYTGVGAGILKGLKGLLPTKGKITDTFSSPRDYGIHGALDLAQPYGSPVKSSLGGGKVTKIGSDKLSGNYVFVKNPKGTTESFSHLSKQNVKLGDIVPTGGVVGETGTTGRVVGVGKGQSVLHYKVRDTSGKAIDPTKVIPAYQKNKSTVSSLGDKLSSASPSIWEQRQKFMMDASNVDTTKLALSNKGQAVDTTNYDNFKNKYNIKNITQDKDGNYKVLASNKTTGEMKSLNASDVLTYDVGGQNKWVKNPAEFSNIGNEVATMPEQKSISQTVGNIADNKAQMIPIPQPAKDKSTRKLKSDNELLNHHIDYGDIA